LSKAIGMMYVAPFVTFFVKSGWHYLAGILPPFWVTKAFFAAENSSNVYYLFFLAGIVSHLAVIYLLLRIFDSRQR